MTIGHVTSLRGRFSDHDWQTLRKVPLLLYYLVASADGVVDVQEADQMGKSLLSAGNCASPLLRELSMDVQNDQPARLMDSAAQAFRRRVATHGFDMAMLSWTRTIRRIVYPRLSPEDFNLFVECLLIGGQAVAEASGGFMGLSPVSAEEQAVLDLFRTYMLC